MPKIKKRLLVYDIDPSLIPVSPIPFLGFWAGIIDEISARGLPGNAKILIRINPGDDDSEDDDGDPSLEIFLEYDRDETEKERAEREMKDKFYQDIRDRLSAGKQKS